MAQRRGIGKDMAVLLVSINTIGAKENSRAGMWFRICGWSVIATFGSAIPIALYNLAPGVGIAGLILAAVSLATFAISFPVGLILVFRT